MKVTREEKKSLEEFRSNLINWGYAVIENDKQVTEHEVAHGLYYLNKEYKKEMVSLINKMPKGMRKMAEKSLINVGYCKSVLKDELHAYFATGIRKRMICIWHHIVYQRYIQKIKGVFKRYYKEVKCLKN